MSNGGASRVSIPAAVRKTIQNIKEITNKHSDDDIYAVLQDCAMDPNETIQKLLYLDTFHVVKKKNDRKKEVLSNRPFADPRPVSQAQGRGARSGGRGNYAPRNFSQDTNGVRNVAPRKENGHSGRNSLPVSHQSKNKETPIIKSLDDVVSGPSNVNNGDIIHSDSSPAEVKNLDATPTPAATYASSIKAQPRKGRGVVTKQIETERSTTSSAERNQTQSRSHLPLKVNHSDPISTIDELGIASSLGKDMPNQSKVVDEIQMLAPNHDSQLSLQDTVPSEVSTSESANITVQAGPQSPPEIDVPVLVEGTKDLHLTDVQHVIFPNHFHVPEEYKSGLTFGSFDLCVGPTGKLVNDAICEEISSHTDDSFQPNDESAEESSPSHQSVPTTAQNVDLSDHLQSPEHVPQNIAVPLEDDSAAQKMDHMKQDSFFPQFPVVQNTHNYNLGLVSPMMGNHAIQFEGSEPQAHIPNFANGNSQVQSTSAPSPPASVSQSSVPSPQQLAFYRQAYPGSFLPYSHYFPPYYVPPVHQYLTHGGFPQQQSTGNVYLAPQAAAATGVKYSLPQNYKLGTTNIGSQTHAGIPSSYVGSFGPGYGLGAGVTSGGSVVNEEFAAAHLKDNNAYTNEQQIEGSAARIPASGREIPNLSANSYYSLPHGHHISFSPAQVTHGAFPGLYHPAQTMTAPSTVHQLMQQQSQGMSGSADALNPPPATSSYQQHQGVQMNWNAGY